MANELVVNTLAGKTVYFVLRNTTGGVWNGAAFVAYVTANYAAYVVTATEQGVASGWYQATMPAVASGAYNGVAKIQAGGAPAETDADAGSGTVYWDGANGVIQSFPDNFGLLGVTATGRVSLNSGWVKNVAVPDFQFLMVLTDGTTPAAGKAVTATRSVDGAAFAACTNAVTELSNGVYTINLSAADLNGGVITFRFTAAGCLDRDICVRTDP